MAVFAVSMCKDEYDIIESSIRRMATQVDALIVADNGSTDGTRDILADLVRDLEVELTVIDDPEVGYFQSRKMSGLAAIAASRGAEWVIPFDADEVWISPHGRISDVLADDAAAAANVAAAALFDHVPTALDDAGADPVQRIQWRRRDAGPLPKVAARPSCPVTIEQGNHAASYPITTLHGALQVRHYALRTPEQMVRKARNGGAAYAATNLPPDVGQHWREWNRLTDEQLHDVFRRFYWSPNPAGDETLIHDPCPSP